MSKRIRAPIAVVTMLALSPLFAPQTVLAATATLGQSTTLSLPLPQYGPLDPADTYDYRLTLTDSNGSTVQDLSMSQLQAGGSVLPIGTDSVTGNVYGTVGASVYNDVYAYTTPNSDTFTLTPWDVGNYTATLQLYDETTNKAVGASEYSVPLSVYAPSTTNQDVSIVKGTFQLTNSFTNDFISLPQSASAVSGIDYHVQIVQSNGNPLDSSNTVSVNYPDNSGQWQTVSAPDGVVTLGGASGLAYPANGQFNFGVSLSKAGNYTVYITAINVTDMSTIGTASTSVEIGNANSSFVVNNASGSAISNAEVGVGWQGWYTDQITADGTPTDYFDPAGSYVVDKIFDPALGADSNGYPLATSFIYLSNQVPITFGSNGQASVTVTEPSYGILTGTLTDGTAPLANASVNIYPIGSDGQPNFNAQALNVQTDSNGTFTANLEVGNYYIQDATVGSTTYKFDHTLTVNQGSNTATLQAEDLNLYFGTPVVGAMAYSWLQFSPDVTAGNVYFKVSVQKDGQPATGVSVENDYVDGTSESFVLDNTGTGVLDQSTPKAFSSLSNGTNDSEVGIQFSQSGTYNITYTVFDASTNQQVAQGTSTVTAASPDVSGTLVAANGITPVPYMDVELENSVGSLADFWTNANGQFFGNLGSGTWTPIKIGQWNSTSNSETWTALSNATPVTVSANGGTATVTVVDPVMNVTGQAFEDGAQMKPLVNGYVGILPNGSSQEVYVNTNANGYFAVDLGAGNYTVVEEGNQDVWNQLSIPFTVTADGSATNVSVAPHVPNITAAVKDALGNTVQQGWVAVMTAQDYTNKNWDNLSWLTISSGQATGYLGAGDYVAVGVSTATNWEAIDVPFTIDASGSVTPASLTFAPPQANIVGSVVDASGNAVANATVVVAPQGDSNPNDVVYLSTDENGNFSSLGWVSGQYTNVLNLNQTYVVEGVGTENGWVNLNETMIAATTAGTSWYIQEPGNDVTGSVTVDSTTVNTGWIAFAPAQNGVASADQSTWTWVQIANGQYNAALPAGSYVVAGIEDDGAGAYYDESSRVQTPFTVSDVTTSISEPVNLQNNFVGTVTGTSNAPQGNVTLVLSQTDQNWDNAQYINTDASGQFSAYLAPGTWYVIGMFQADGTYTPLDIQETVGTSSGSLNISVAANTTGSINWGSTAPAGVTDAWLWVKNETTGNWYPLAVDPSTNWSFSAVLPTGATYDVEGLSYATGSGNAEQWQWYDMSGLGATLTTSTGQTVAINAYSGTVNISGVTGPGYVLFSKTVGNQTQYVKAPFDASGQFTTTADGTWTVLGVETSENYTPVTAGQGVFSNLTNTWTIT